MKSLESLELENRQLELANRQLCEKVAILSEQLEWFRRQIFGKKSEKIIPISNPQQLILPGLEPPEEKPPEKQVIPRHERTKPKRGGQDKISLPADLPVERVY
jgi:transposase